VMVRPTHAVATALALCKSHGWTCTVYAVGDALIP
jgi:hypothetical protein